MEDKEYGFVDRTGKKVVPFTYWDAGSFSGGLAWVMKKYDYGFIDTTGNIVIQLRYDRAWTFSNEGFALVMDIDYGFGFVDINGAEVISCEYDSAAYGDGYFTLIKDGYLSILDKDLNRVF